jgi:hypothetical protein
MADSTIEYTITIFFLSDCKIIYAKNLIIASGNKTYWQLRERIVLYKIVQLNHAGRSRKQFFLDADRDLKKKLFTFVYF